jgi:phage terminase large subunit-like protein
MTEKDILKYCDKVLTGKVIAGELETLAVKRHLQDLESCYERGLYFDPKAGMKVIQFFKFLRHAKGKFANKPFELSDWQAFKLFVQYGWKKKNGKRRFRLSYIDMGRKNGKTAFAGGECLYNLIADGEQAAEIYTAATTFGQAAICFNDTKQILAKSPLVRTQLQSWSKSITHEASGSRMMPLHSKTENLDGLNPSFAVIDEYHAHPNDKVFDILETGMGARENPMISVITTAGFNKQGPCFQFRNVAIQVLKGILQQDDLFALMYSLDKDDDWEDQSAWRKCNPNLDISFDIDYLQSMYQGAKNNPAKLVSFKTKNLNLWVDAAVVWIEDEAWQACDLGEVDCTGLECIGGLDLASTRDLSALALKFVMPNGHDVYIWKFWMPEDNVQERVRKDMVPYDIWIEQGYINTTPGNVTDYDFIVSEIVKLKEQYNIKSIAYDRWNSSQAVQDLKQEGLTMNPYGQGFASMSAPTKEFEMTVYTRKINHMGNPVMRWMISNVSLMRDAADNNKVDKAKSREKVDGVVAAIMAKGEQMTFKTEEKPDLNKIYAERGIRTL